MNAQVSISDILEVLSQSMVSQAVGNVEAGMRENERGRRVWGYRVS